MAYRIASFDVGMKNLGIWAGEFKPENKVFPFYFTHWEVLDLGTCQLKEACESMVREFERRPFLNECDWILVENQIDDTLIGRRGKGSYFKVGRMKAVAQAIKTYFYTKRYVECKPANLEHLDQILSISSRTKLKVWDGMGFTPKVVMPRSFTHTKTGKPKKTSRYQYNKVQGIAQTQQLLARGIEASECDGKWLVYFNGLQKQDDAADAFLQAAYWVLRFEDWNEFMKKGRVVGDEPDSEAEDFW